MKIKKNKFEKYTRKFIVYWKLFRIFVKHLNQYTNMTNQPTTPMTKTNKRTKTLGLHQWTENDTILCYYYTKYGLKNLMYNTEEKLSGYIGTTLNSLRKQSMNFRYLMGKNTKTLSDFSKLQKDVFDVMEQYTFTQVHKFVKDIINQDDFERYELLKQKGVDPTRFKLLR